MAMLGSMKQGSSACWIRDVDSKQPQLLQGVYIVPML
jgi:hypothetical protein